MTGPRMVALDQKCLACCNSQYIFCPRTHIKPWWSSPFYSWYPDNLLARYLIISASHFLLFLGCSGHHVEEVQVSRGVRQLFHANVLDAGVTVFYGIQRAQKEIQQGCTLGVWKQKWAVTLQSIGRQPRCSTPKFSLLGRIARLLLGECNRW